MYDKKKTITHTQQTKTKQKIKNTTNNSTKSKRPKIQNRDIKYTSTHKLPENRKQDRTEYNRRQKQMKTKLTRKQKTIPSKKKRRRKRKTKLTETYEKE